MVIYPHAVPSIFPQIGRERNQKTIEKHVEELKFEGTMFLQIGSTCFSMVKVFSNLAIEKHFEPVPLNNALREENGGHKIFAYLSNT